VYALISSGDIVDISEGLESVSYTKGIGEVNSFTLTYRPTLYTIGEGSKSRYKLTEFLIPNDVICISIKRTGGHETYEAVFLGFVSQITRTKALSPKQWSYTVNGVGWENVFRYSFFIPQTLAGFLGDPSETIFSILQTAPVEGTPDRMIKQIVDYFYNKPVMALKELKQISAEELIRYLYGGMLQFGFAPPTQTPVKVIPFSVKSKTGEWTMKIPRPEVVVVEGMEPIGYGYLGSTITSVLNENASVIQVLTQLVGGGLWNDIIYDVISMGKVTPDAVKPVIFIRRRPIGWKEMQRGRVFQIDEESVLNESITTTDAELVNLFDLQFQGLLAPGDTPPFMFARAVAEEGMSIEQVVDPMSVRQHGLRFNQYSSFLWPKDLVDVVLGKDKIDDPETEIGKISTYLQEGSITDGMKEMFDRLKRQYGQVWLTGTMTIPFVEGVRAGDILQVVRTHTKHWKKRCDEAYNIERLTVNWRFGTYPTMTLDLTRGVYLEE
jgi:hypothetical protein